MKTSTKLKTLLLLTIWIFVLSSCKKNSYCNIVVIDSCEYIKYTHFQGVGITHKGNCKNH